MRRIKGAKHANAAVRASGRVPGQEATAARKRYRINRELNANTREQYADTLPLDYDGAGAETSGLDHEAPRHKVLDIG